MQVALFFVAKRFAVANEKLKVPRVRLIDVWMINFVNDAVAEREPETAAGVIRSADAFLRTESPARLDSRGARRNIGVTTSHHRTLRAGVPEIKAVSLTAEFFARTESFRKILRRNSIHISMSD